MSGFAKFLWPLALPLLVSFFAAALAHKSFADTLEEEEDLHAEDDAEFSEKPSSGKTSKPRFAKTLHMTMPAAFTSHTLWGIGSLAVLGSSESIPWILCYVILLVWSLCLMVMSMKRFPGMSLILLISGAVFLLARCLLFLGAPGI